MGRLHLSGLVLLAPYLTPENAEGLIQAACGKTRREIERMLSERFPQLESLDLPCGLPASSPIQDPVSAPGRISEHAWEKPAKAILDHFHLDAVDWLGASCGGYLALRAAAFEPRIKHVISLPQRTGALT